MVTNYINRNLRQKITYWSPGIPDGFGGIAYGLPLARLGRWEDKSVLFIDSDGQEVRSVAVVYLKEDVELEGYLFLGTSISSNPTLINRAFEIRAFSKIPNLQGTLFERMTIL